MQMLFADNNIASCNPFSKFGFRDTLGAPLLKWALILDKFPTAAGGRGEQTSCCWKRLSGTDVFAILCAIRLVCMLMLQPPLTDDYCSQT
jgi:hypothetical protein